jgi:hypothetical protein
MSLRQHPQADAAPGGYTGRAFGLRVDSQRPLAGFRPSTADGRTGGPATRVALLSGAEIDAVWQADAELVYAPPTGDGGIPFTVERTANHYRFWLEGFGRYVVSADGTFVGCERGGATPAQHERFVVAQALPVAAVLQGFEVLHASAVRSGAGAAAFAGPSGAGKTTLAGGLVLRGADFLTDDVLAIEPGDDGPLAHPGPPFMAIRPAHAAAMTDAGGRLGDGVGATDKVHFSPPGGGQAAPLSAIYHLEPGDAVAISALADAGPQRILGLAFVPYLMSPQRLIRHLALGQLLSHVAQFRLQAPRTGLSDVLLDAVEAHIRQIGL